MMCLGSLGVGGPSSSSSYSSSNLSALATPFTVDRFNPKPSSNPLLQFSDSPPYAAPFGHTWQYSTTSVPRQDMYPKSELDIDSTTTTPVPLGYSVSPPNDPPWSTVNPRASASPKTSTGAFLYDCKVEPYYPPYVSSVVNDDSPLVALSEPSYDMLPSSDLVCANVSSPIDYTQCLSGLEYTPRWHGVWYGSADAKPCKNAEIDGGFSLDKTNARDSSAYGNQINQGYYTVQCGDILEEHFGISSGQFSDAVGRERNNGLVSMQHMDNMSLAAQRVLSLPFDFSTTTISTSSFTVPASQPPGSFLHSPKNFMNHQMPQNTNQKCIRPLDSSISGSISATKSSPALVIRPPPFGSALVSQKVSSGKTVDTGNAGAVHQNEGLGKNNPFKGKEHQSLLNSEVEEGSLFKSQFKYQKEGSGLIFTVPSSVRGDRSSKPQTGDGLKNVLNVKSGSQVPNINVADDSSLSRDSFQAIHSSDNVLDCLDHHSFAVDSPCWKGAPASHFSPFDVMETETTHPFVKKLDKFCQLDLQVDQTFSLVNGPIRCSFEQAGQDTVHECGHEGRGITPIPGNNSEADYTAREQRSVNAAKARFKDPIMTNSKGVQFCEENIKPKEEYDLPKHSKNDSVTKSYGRRQLGLEEDNLTMSELNFQAAAMDSGLDISDTTEGAVAVRAAENVLCSPSSEEGVPEQAKPVRGESAPKMDVQALIRGLRSVSDLVLFNCLTDLCALQDEDIEVLKHVMSNLDTLVSKKMGILNQTQEPILNQQDTYDKVAQFLDPPLSNAAQFEKEVGVKSYGHLDNQNTHEEIRNQSVSREKPENFQPLFPLRDDLDVLRDDNMAQAIKKVLEENFHCGEELESQALIFKNLWLEAEAKLCSISYRARFDRMKIEMQKFSSNQAKENAAASDNTPSSNSSHDLNISDVPSLKVENGSMEKTTILSLPSLNSTSNTNDVEASDMSRFHILKCRDDSKSTNLVGEEADDLDAVCSSKMLFLRDQVKDGRLNVALEPLSHKKGDVNQDHVGIHVGGSGNELLKDGLSLTSNADDVEASVTTRFHILKCRDDSKTTNVVGQQAGMVDPVYCGIMPFLKDQVEDGRLNVALGPHSHRADEVNQGHVGLHLGGSGYESLKKKLLCDPDDPVTQSSATSRQRNQYSLGFNDNSSSDWEHVLKDDVSWHL